MEANHQNPYKEVGKKIRSARQELGLTQQAVASQVGASREAIVNLEAGRRKNVDFFEMKAIGRTLGIEI